MKTGKQTDLIINCRLQHQGRPTTHHTHSTAIITASLPQCSHMISFVFMIRWISNYGTLYLLYDIFLIQPSISFLIL